MVFGMFLLCCNLLIPILMLIFGTIFLKHPPENRNRYYGYRTKRSMLNQNTWDYAHQYCGIIWKRIGIVMIFVSLAVSVPMFWMNEKMRGILTCIVESVQVIILIGSIFPVERALKQRFDKDGTPKTSDKKQ